MTKRRVYLLVPVLITFLFVFCKHSGKASPVSGVNATNEDSSIHPTGAIAFIRNRTEIRLVDSNGQNDRRIWTDPDINENVGIHDVAWRPDGKELAFSSGHEVLFSLYDADIYCIHPDGTGIRRVTNSPDKKELQKFKKGIVTVTVRNSQSMLEHSKASEGVFFVTMAGANDPQMVTIPPGSAKTLVFKAVADFGDDIQPIVAMNGNFRWFMPGIDVKAGQTNKAPDFVIKGNGTEYFGAYCPVWKQDGSLISYRNGFCAIQTISSHPPEGAPRYNPMFQGESPAGTCTWAYGPTPALSNQIIYTENGGDGSGIFMLKEGGIHDPSTKLVQFSDIPSQVLNDLKWLPDGSGFLYSVVNLVSEGADIFRYDLRTKQTKQLTQLQGEFARRFCVSPSGKWIVYEKGKTNDEDNDVDLWIMKSDGTDAKLLVKNGLCPSWSK
jgi:hypothetical protein